jgi:hypothetical protein
VDVPLWALRLSGSGHPRRAPAPGQARGIAPRRNPRLGRNRQGWRGVFPPRTSTRDTREGLEKVLPGIRALAEMIHELPQKDRMAVEAY